MDDKVEIVTYVILKLVDALLLANPFGTALGSMVGFIIHGLISFLFPAFVKVFGVIHFVLSGIVVFNIPAYINRNKRDPKIESKIMLIEQLAKEGKISRVDARQHYRALIFSVIQQVEIKGSFQKKTSYSSNQYDDLE